MTTIGERHDEKQVWVSVPVRTLSQVLDLVERDNNGPIEEQDEENRAALLHRLYSQVSPNTRKMLDYLAGSPGEYVLALDIAHSMGLGSTNAQMNSYNSAIARLGIKPEVIEADKLTPGQWWFRVGQRDAETIREASTSHTLVENH